MQNPFRPDQLSTQFVKLLYQTYGKHTGYFQIVQFHQKKSKYYSTHIADGFYKCKVIFRDKASKQLDSGQIKLFSVLYGTITNQGQRVLMAFESLQIWPYPRTIGVVRSWRNQITDIYMNGSNFINWNDQSTTDNPKQQNLDYSQQDILASTATLTLTQSIDFSTINISGFNTKFIQQQQNINILSEKTISSVYSFGSDPIIQSSTSNIQQNIIIQQHQIPKSSLQQQHINKLQQNKKTFKLLLISQTYSQQDNSQKKQNQKCNKSPKQIIDKQNQTNKSNHKITNHTQVLQTLDNNTTTHDKSQHYNNNHIQPSSPPINDDQDIFSQLLTQASRLKSLRTTILLQQSTQSLIKQIYSNKYSKTNFHKILQNQHDNTNSILHQQQHLLSNFKNNYQSEYSNPSYNHSKKSTLQYFFQSDKKLPHKNINNQTNSLPSSNIKKSNNQHKYPKIFNTNLYNNTSIYHYNQLEDHQIRVQQLRTITSCNLNKKWIKIIILAQKYIQQGHHAKTLYVAQQILPDQYGQIFNILLTNTETSPPLQPCSLYKIFLSNFDIVYPNIQLFTINIQLHANTSNLQIQKIQLQQPNMIKNDTHPSYVSLEKIQNINQLTSVNIVAIILQYKNVLNKKKGFGWINIFTITDPFNTTTIDFTTFDSQKLMYKPGTPILIYNSIIKFYQNKKILSTSNYTIYYINKQIIYNNFIYFIPKLNKIKTWQQSGNTITDIIQKNINFLSLQNLLSIQPIINGQQFHPNQLNVQTPLCRVVKISPFFIQFICDSCNKSIHNFYCFFCGKRQHPLQQLHLSFAISDNTHKIFVQCNHYDSLSLIGNSGQGLPQFITNTLHKRIKLWLTLKPRYKATIIKMQLYQPFQIVSSKLTKLKQLIHFI